MIAIAVRQMTAVAILDDKRNHCGEVILNATEAIEFMSRVNGKQEDSPNPDMGKERCPTHHPHHTLETWVVQCLLVEEHSGPHKSKDSEGYEYEWRTE